MIAHKYKFISGVQLRLANLCHLLLNGATDVYGRATIYLP